MFLRAARTAAGMLAAILATTGAAAPVPADRVKEERQLAATAAKLHGTWLGAPCEGNITFRANGTYEWTGRGPINLQDSGVWTLRGNPANPRLVLVCRRSSGDREVGQTYEYGLASVNGERILLKHPEDEKPRTYERAEMDWTRD